MSTVTGRDISTALAGQERAIAIRKCSLCDCDLYYYIKADGRVLFDSNCGCVRYSVTLEERSWDDLADLINMQEMLKWRNHYRNLFGLPPEPET